MKPEQPRCVLLVCRGGPDTQRDLDPVSYFIDMVAESRWARRDPSHCGGHSRGYVVTEVGGVTILARDFTRSARPRCSSYTLDRQQRQHELKVGI